MSKFYKAVSLFAFTLILLTACKKDNPSPTTNQSIYPIEGLWIGTYTVDNLTSQGSLSYNFYIKPGGKILTESLGGDGKGYYASGTWAISGSDFTATILTFASGTSAPVTQSISATFSNEGTLTNASWKDTNNPNGPSRSGKFSTMQRIN